MMARKMEIEFSHSKTDRDPSGMNTSHFGVRNSVALDLKERSDITRETTNR